MSSQLQQKLIAKYRIVIIICLGILVAGFLLRKPAANFFLSRGNYYFNGGAYDLPWAIRYYRLVLIFDKKTPNARYRLSDALFVSGDADGALKEINQVILENPNFGKAYYIRGLVYGMTKRPDEAIRDFKKIIELGQLSETSWAVYNDLSWVEFQKGDYSSVEETTKEGLMRYPNNPWLLNSQGLALLNLGRKKEAESVLTEALARAEALTEEGVVHAYPGNDSRIATEKRTSIINTIRLNLVLAKN